MAGGIAAVGNGEDTERDSISFEKIPVGERWGLAFFGAMMGVVVPFLDSKVGKSWEIAEEGLKSPEYVAALIAVIIVFFVSMLVVAKTKLPSPIAYFLGAVSLPATLFGGLVISFKFL